MLGCADATIEFNSGEMEQISVDDILHRLYGVIRFMRVTSCASSGAPKHDDNSLHKAPAGIYLQVHRTERLL